ncbi:hypothetical protein LXL04_029342 [Taraxacum kok-saghyz]
MKFDDNVRADHVFNKHRGFRAQILMLVQVRTIIKFENGGTNLARYKSHSKLPGIKQVTGTLGRACRNEPRNGGYAFLARCLEWRCDVWFPRLWAQVDNNDYGGNRREELVKEGKSDHGEREQIDRKRKRQKAKGKRHGEVKKREEVMAKPNLEAIFAGGRDAGAVENTNCKLKSFCGAYFCKRKPRMDKLGDKVLG